jgi:hypothetical protein
MISEGPALFVKASDIGSPIKALDSGQEISPKVPLLLPQISPLALEETSGETRETLPSFNTPSMGPLLRQERIKFTQNQLPKACDLQPPGLEEESRRPQLALLPGVEKQRGVI